jgi:hypothetical protein
VNVPDPPRQSVEEHEKDVARALEQLNSHRVAQKVLTEEAIGRIRGTVEALLEDAKRIEERMTFFEARSRGA